ncbi:hypothetical protein QR680_007009 [Steinernema hermaphroditum]|uniref:Mitochondrial import inner membrane translocase subunit TIM50 n=1 Tax=Steinernema hermaphroditum TaxID=289476 RepID=A0AA39HYG5_9BILA|nr:hypothetical protein QR680_007009 [Steinernema hermaphroditum]
MATSRFLQFSTASSSKLLVKQRIIAIGQPCRLLASSSDDRPKGIGFSAVRRYPPVVSPFDNPGRVNMTKITIEKPQNQPEPEVKAVVHEEPKETVEPQMTEPLAAAPAAVKKNGLFRQFKERFGLHIDEDLPEDEKKRQKTTRNTKVGGFFVFGGSLVGLVYFCYYYGRAKRDDEGNVIKDEHSGSILAPFYRVLNGYYEWRDYVIEPSRKVLLPDPLPPPYHQPKYTLVLEMKNVLVNPEWSYRDGHRFKKRPALDYFLDVVGYPNFEVVIYSVENSFTAEPIAHSIDPKQRIMYRLYRDNTKYMKGAHVKDLSRLNRDLSKVIYIDFDPQSYQLNPENVLRVPKWEGDMNDTTLVDLAELLKTIHLSDVDDVRPTLQYYSQFDDPAKEFRNRAMYVAEQEQKRKEETGQGQGYLSKYSSWIPGRRHRV